MIKASEKVGYFMTTKKLKKIVMYIDMMGHGGAQRVMANLAGYFADSDVKVILVNDFKLRDKQAQYQMDARIKRYYLREALEGNKLIKNIERMRELRRIVKRENPDIILSFLGRPNKRMLVATLGLKNAKIVSVRNDPCKEYGSGFVKRNLARLLFCVADGCIFQTTDAQKYFPASVQRKSTVIVNPVGEQFYSLKREEQTKDIISIGRLEAQKNNRLLIRAFADIADKYPEENLVFYGEGSMRHDLELLVKELQLGKRVVFAGDTSHVPEKLQGCTLFVLSSDYEGMPNALMEAMAAGVPCISTDCPCGGPRGLMESGKEGLLVPVGNMAQMSKAMDAMLGNPERRLWMAANGREKARQFKAGRVFGLYNQYFNKVMSK